MFIKKLYATFGSLSNKTLELGQGLNIVQGKNEAGKSTWSAFIRAMFYGISTRDKAKLGYLPDKERYLPFSGEPMYGRMEMSFRGDEIEIERTSARSGVFSKAEARNITRGGKAPLGEELCGVTQEVYERCAFVAQAKVGVSGSHELEKKILSIASSGEEGVSAKAVSERLLDKQREIRSPRGLGALPKIEGEIDALLSERRLRAGAAEEAREASEHLECILREEKVLLRALSAAKAFSAREELRTRTRAAEEDRAFGGLSKEEAKARAKEDNARLEGALRRRVSPLGIALLALSAASVAAVFAVGALALIATAVLAASGVAILLTSGKSRQNEEKLALTARYGALSAGAISGALEGYLAALRRCEEAEAALPPEEVGAPPAASAMEISRKLERMSEDRARLEIRLATLRERASGYDAKAAEESLAALLGKKAELMLRFDAYSLAMRVMAEADQELKSRFSPEVEKRAGEIFKALTGGNFEIVRIKNNKFDIEVATGEASARRDELYLSQGTLDELYLAVRLALCEMILPKEEAPPIVLDDVFVNFDDERLARALSLLSEMAETRQIIIFTCHTREARLMQGKANIVEI